LAAAGRAEADDGAAAVDMHKDWSRISSPVATEVEVGVAATVTQVLMRKRPGAGLQLDQQANKRLEELFG
jgi:hypothetical protein